MIVGDLKNLEESFLVIIIKIMNYCNFSISLHCFTTEINV